MRSHIMAKQTKTKKSKTRVKKTVSMTLKQGFREPESMNDRQKERVYQAFRKRCEVKSGHAYVDLGETPELLRLYMLGTKFNSTVEFLVKFGSFKPIKAKNGPNRGEEIGFRIKLKSPLTKKTMTLEVFRGQFKATLILPSWS